MDPYNPYQAPSVGGYGHALQAAPGSDPITPTMIDHLRNARPWLRLLSILFFLGAGLMLVASLFMLVAGAAVMSAAPTGSGPAAALAPLLGLIYLPLAGVYLLPAIFMHRLANGIDQAVITPSARTLEDTLDRHRVFWKVMGIMALVFIGLWVFGVFAAVVAGVLAAKP
jgi:hypothetical protein